MTTYRPQAQTKNKTEKNPLPKRNPSAIDNRITDVPGDKFILGNVLNNLESDINNYELAVNNLQYTDRSIKIREADDVKYLRSMIAEAKFIAEESPKIGDNSFTLLSE